MMRNRWFVLGVCVFCLAFLAVVSLAGRPGVTICHIPPGNPDHPQTITVAAHAIPVHLAHGDTLIPCA